MATCHLTSERLRELLDYDSSTGLFIRLQGRSNGIKVGDVVGSRDKDGYLRVLLDGSRYRLQRLAWFYVYGCWPKGVVDHINRIRDDNRIENLRDVSQGVNMQNQVRARSKYGTGFIGVTANQGKYQARICTDGANTHVGTFASPQEASAAYQAAKRLLHMV